MKIYIIGQLKATQEFIEKATENSQGNLRVEHNNVSNDITFKQLTAFQLSRNSIKDADYVVFLNDDDFTSYSDKVGNAPCTLYFGDETPEHYIKEQIKFELENASVFAQKPADVELPAAGKTSSVTSFLSIFANRNTVKSSQDGLEMKEFESSNSLKAN